jgi:hypothetical protein
VIVALISSDLRVKQSLPALLAEVDSDLVLSRFESIEEMVRSEKPESKEEKEKREAAELAAAEKAKSEPKTAKALLDAMDSAEDDDEGESPDERDLRESLRYYQMVIIDLDQLSPEWSADHHAKLRAEIAAAETPSIRRPAVFVLSGQGPASLFCFAEFNDLIMKPIDRQLFQQKAAHLLAGHGLRAESQLYMATTSSMVEIGKDIRFVSITELGFEVLNPSPLKPGVQAFLHVELGETRREVKWMRFPVKAVSSLPRGSEYAVQMMLEDPSAEDVQQLRKLVRNNASRTNMHFAPGSQQPLRLGLVCFDPHRRSEIQGLLRNQFRGLEIEVYRTYQDYVVAKSRPAVGALAAFQASQATAGVGAGESVSGAGSGVVGAGAGGSIASGAGNSGSAPSAYGLPGEGVSSTGSASDSIGEAGDSAEAPAVLEGRLVLMLSSERGEVVSLAAEGQGTLVTQLEQKKITRLLELAGSATNEQRELEQLWSALLAMGQSSEGVFQCDGQPIHIKLSPARSETGGLVSAEMIPASNELLREYRQPSTASGLAVDALLIDDWQWPESQSVAAKDPNAPAVVVIRDRAIKERGLRFLTGDIFNSLFWPLDRRWLGHVLLITAQLRAKSVVVNEAGLVPQRADLAGRGVSTKPISIDRVSEYGVRLVLPSALKPGSFLKVYSPLFELSDRSGDEAIVIGLVAESTVTEDKPPKTLTFVKFFGASEALTKRIRSRIREQYAQEKEKAQS